MRFAERPGTDPAKRPVREIVGVDPRLNQRWSTRRVHIEARRGELRGGLPIAQSMPTLPLKDAVPRGWDREIVALVMQRTAEHCLHALWTG